MAKLLRTLTVLLFLGTVLTASPAAAQTCDYLVTCFDYLPEHQTPHPAWQYSHQCCDLNDHTTIWYVYIDFADRWHLVRTQGPVIDP